MYWVLNFANNVWIYKLYTYINSYIYVWSINGYYVGHRAVKYLKQFKLQSVIDDEFFFCCRNNVAFLKYFLLNIFARIKIVYVECTATANCQLSFKFQFIIFFLLNQALHGRCFFLFSLSTVEPKADWRGFIWFLMFSSNISIACVENMLLRITSLLQTFYSYAYWRFLKLSNLICKHIHW